MWIKMYGIEKKMNFSGGIKHGGQRANEFELKANLGMESNF